MTNQSERVDTLGDAVRFVAQRHDLDPRAVVELYPRTSFDRTGRIFAYQFFDKTGRNVGYYLPDMGTANSWPPGTGRSYAGWQQKQVDRIDWAFKSKAG